MHRFFLMGAALQPGAEVELSVHAHQLSRVLRLRPGDRILGLDGRGQAATVEIRSLERRRAVGLVLDSQAVSGEPRVRLTLYQCSLKAEKFEWVLQKATELGVHRFVPVISQRSVVRPAAALRLKYPRWQAILQEAAEQCSRGLVPELAEPHSWHEAVQSAVLPALLLWEESCHPGLGQRLADLRPAGQVKPQPELALLIGPEGGIAPAEVDVALATGWQLVSLGPRLLRAETAALAAVAVAMAAWGELG